MIALWLFRRFSGRVCRIGHFVVGSSDMNEMRLFDTAGNRLYLNAADRAAFLSVARQQAKAEVRTFCETLHYTGCRLSEALERHCQVIWECASMSGSRPFRRRPPK